MRTGTRLSRFTWAGCCGMRRPPTFGEPSIVLISGRMAAGWWVRVGGWLALPAAPRLTRPAAPAAPGFLSTGLLQYPPSPPPRHSSFNY